MSSKYSVVQFVPDLIADERINIGVIVTDSNGSAFRFVTDWRRVQHFAGLKPANARSIVDDLERFIASQEGLDLTRAAKEWSHSVQISAPKSSLLPLEDLLDEVSARVLREATPRRRPRTKTALVASARVALERKLDHLQADDAEEDEPRVEGKVSVPGRHVAHTVDLALSNGHLLVAAQAISFNRAAVGTIDKDVAATAWTIDDIKQGTDPPTLAIIVGRPDGGATNTYRSAVKLFRELDAEVVDDRGIEAWAGRVVDSLSA